jgi:hypothetical protein
MKHLIFLFLVTVFLWNVMGCREEPCSTVGKEKCDGDMIQRCPAGGVWEDWYDCTLDDLKCYTAEDDTVSCVTAEEVCDDVCLE